MIGYTIFLPSRPNSNENQFYIMGKGDIKSKKGKLANGSFGKSRKRNETMPKVALVAATPIVEEKPKKTAAKPKAKKV